jgi:hypothetical protein
MRLSAFDPGSWRALESRFKLALGALAAGALAWTPGPAHAVTYTFQNIIDPLNPTFTQALGINNAGTIVGYGNATIFNGFQLILPPVPANFTRLNFTNADGGTQVVGISGTGTTVGFFIIGGSRTGSRTPAMFSESSINRARPSTSFSASTSWARLRPAIPPPTRPVPRSRRR